MIEFTNLVITYPGAPGNAVDGVSFSALPGSLTALAGPNGSGKSSLVKALIRRVDVSGGAITVNGRDATQYEPADLARLITVVPQREDATFPMSVREYTALGRYPHLGLWGTPGDADRSAVDDALSQADVAGLADRDTDALSGGEWQRVRIARALAQRAPALILDEPTTFLDVSHEMAIFELLHSLSRSGLAVLLVSHQLNLVARFADTIVVLSEGRVATSGEPNAVMEANRLEAIYGWPVVVSRDPAVGAPMLVPLRRPRPLAQTETSSRSLP